jgi:uncharacterized coiled-coil protein SlyX
MGRHQRRVSVTVLVTFTLLCNQVVYAEPQVGDKAKNLKVLPPWTMRVCPKEFYATYGAEEALELKKKDNDCWLWNERQRVLQEQVTDQGKVIEKLKLAGAAQEQVIKNGQAREAELVKQLKQEVTEKNTYKYKPNYGWIYVTVGAALAAVGIAFGVGVWVAQK